MASERILKLRDLIDNYDELLKYVPIQDIQYTPDPDKNVIYRFADTVIANLDQSQPAHIPGSWIAGTGGYFFRTEAKKDWLLKEFSVWITIFTPLHLLCGGMYVLMSK